MENAFVRPAAIERAILQGTDLPPATDLATTKGFEQTYPGFSVNTGFSLATFEVAKLQNDRTIEIPGKSYSFKTGTPYVLMTGENIQKQKSNVMGGDGADHTWTIRLFSIENEKWVGQLNDSLKHPDYAGLSMMPQANTDITDGNNRNHVIVLVPMKKDVPLKKPANSTATEEAW